MILTYFLISRHCCSVARLVVGEPDVGLVLQSKAAAKQSQTRRPGTDTEVECEGLAGVVSLVVEGIELRLKLAGLIDQETDVEGEDLDGVASLLKGETGLRHVKQFQISIGI